MKQEYKRREAKKTCRRKMKQFENQRLENMEESTKAILLRSWVPEKKISSKNI